MKIRYLAAFAGCAAPFLSSDHSHAAYLGLSTQLHTTVSVTGLNGGLKSVYRVYAVFSNPDDIVNAVVGSKNTGTLTIQSLDSSGTFPGSNFYNPNSGGDTAPANYGNYFSPPQKEWDTFATIGKAFNNVNDPFDYALALTPGFPTFIAGNQLVNDDLAWYILPVSEQGQAGGPNGKPNLTTDFTALTGTGILIMQLTVNAGQHVTGTVAVNGISDGETFTATAQTFASLIPAPPALLLLFAPALFSNRRRT